MSKDTDYAEVVIRANGQQAHETLEKLRKKAEELKAKMKAYQDANDTLNYNRLDKELGRVTKSIKQATAQASACEKVLQSLDKATCNDLRTVIKMVDKELHTLGERGTEDYNKLAKSSAKFANELRKADEELKVLRIDQETVNKTLKNVNTASYRDLEYTYKSLNAQLKLMQRGTAEWNATSAKMATVGLEMKKIDQEAKSIAIDTQTVKKTLQDLNAATPTQLVATIEALEQKIRTLGPETQAFAKATKELSAVRARYDEINKIIKSTSSDTQVLARTMKNLKGASPEDLKKSLQILESQLKTLSRQSSRYSRLEKQVNRLRAECKAVDEAMKQTAIDTQLVNQTLNNIKGASVKDLKYTLEALNRELKAIPANSAAWDQQAAKIRAVKTQLAALNTQIEAHTGLWSRINSKLNHFQTMIMGAIASIGMIVMAGRKAVKAYADMEESLANTQKYTRMTREDVEKLNESFLKMDTRVARSELNALAQEAGRLGKNTIKDVQEYVDASQIIKVALVDLGDGATQTIAKISNIFGEEEKYGIRKSMLKVGSTVNHLSQICTASKPYIVEFTQRMAGIGSTAKMTIPDIMAFASTLDANGQKVEMSASALSRLIMKLFQAPGDVAKQVGLDVKEFTDTLNKSTTQGVMMFLEQLHKIGGKDAMAALSPLFKDLGMDGVRMAQVLANLSSHLDMLKQQMGEAATAYREASSATNEFNIFNNTAQARIDKAKKKLSELTIELGEKLYPVMAHIYTSGSIAIRVLNKLVDFFNTWGVTILRITALIYAYNLGMKLQTSAITADTLATDINRKAKLLWEKAIKACTTVAKGMLLVFKEAFALNATALSLGIAKLTGNTTRAAAATRKFKMELNACKAAAATLAVGFVAVGIALYSLISSLTKTSKEVKEYQKAVEGAVKGATGMSEATIKEQTELDRLYGTMRKARKESEEYQNAKKAIITQYGQYLSGLIDEKGEILNLADAYDILTKAIRRSNAERAINAAQNDLDTQWAKDLAEGLAQIQNALEGEFGAIKAAEMIVEVRDYFTNGIPMSKNTKDSIAGLGIKKTPQTAGAWAMNFLGIGDDTIQDINPVFAFNTLLQKHNAYDKATQNLEATSAKYQELSGLANYQLEQNIKQLQQFVGLDTQPADWGHVGDYVDGPLVARRDLIVKHPEHNPFSGQNTIGNIDPGSIVSLGLWNSDGTKFQHQDLTREQARSMLADFLVEQQARRKGAPARIENSDENEDDYKYTRQLTDKELRAMSAEMKKRIKEALAGATAQFKTDLAEIKNKKNNGEISFDEYQAQVYTRTDQYYTDERKVYEDFKQKDTKEYAELLVKKEKLDENYFAFKEKRQAEMLKRNYDAEVRQINSEYNDPQSELFKDNEIRLDRLYAAEYDYLIKVRDLHQKDSKEWEEADFALQIRMQQEAIAQQKQLEEDYANFLKNDKQSLLEWGYRQEKRAIDRLHAYGLISEEQYQKQLRDIERKYRYRDSDEQAFKNDIGNNPAENKSDYTEKINALTNVYNTEMALAEDNARRKFELERWFYQQKEELAKKYLQREGDDQISGWEKTNTKILDWLNSDVGKAVVGTANIAIGQMGETFSNLTSLIQAETAKQSAYIERRYDREVARAQGNNYKIAKLEKKKQKELAKLQRDANKKMFAMQVLQAIAQTAQNAISAYGSAAAIPLVGYILAPIAAAMATANGMLQIAVIKKQQEAAEAQSGYSQGGFTGDGQKDEVAGVVHKREWVAPQWMVDSPTSGPIIDALEFARRNNTVASLSPEMASSYIAAPQILAQGLRSIQPVVVQSQQPTAAATSTHAQLTASLDALNRRLAEPMGAVVTVEGDYGLKNAQRKYNQLIANKTPKSRRKDYGYTN